ncbi:hypothetical protein [Flavobacterium sp. ABG]|nr:hypothetical protein [Flavobacterium sp. ABG]
MKKNPFNPLNLWQKEKPFANIFSHRFKGFPQIKQAFVSDGKKIK